LRLIPVLDILNGVVVRGVAGNRDQYGPIESCLTKSVQALDVARAIRGHFGFDEFYVADLDAIIHHRTREVLYRELIADGFRLSIDAGVADAAQAQTVLASGAERVIIGLESCPSPLALQQIVDAVSTERVVFSLDLKNGIPLASPEWGTDPVAIAVLAISCGVTQLIVLDLAGVGTGAGVPTIPLCQTLRAKYGSAIQIITGGGVRDQADLDQLEQVGIDGVLVASILHQPDFYGIALFETGRSTSDL
jgi:phosphoribosylformimino-5-aminoimidazole carboxamide ribotide isomerase